MTVRNAKTGFIIIWNWSVTRSSLRNTFTVFPEITALLEMGNGGMVWIKHGFVLGPTPSSHYPVDSWLDLSSPLLPHLLFHRYKTVSGVCGPQARTEHHTEAQAGHPDDHGHEQNSLRCCSVRDKPHVHLYSNPRFQSPLTGHVSF